MVSKALSLAKLLGDNNKLSTDTFGDDVSTIEQASSTDVLTNLGNAVGDQRLVGSNLYIWNGSGWYRIALINQTPTWDSGGQPASSYVLDRDSPQDATIITLAASDPDGLPISYSYVTSGSMDSMATISQDSSVFTITPKTVAQVGEGVELTGSITFRASDGVNILPSVSSFTLSFIFEIENSRYTTLLATATGTSDNNDITDSSTSNHTITVNGDAHAGTFSPYTRGGYGFQFDGSNQFVSIPHNSNVAWFGQGQFTIEFWVRLNEVGTNQQFFDFRPYPYSDPAVDVYRLGSDNKVYVRANGATRITSTTLLDTAGEWYHILVHRDSASNLKLFINGTQTGSTVTGYNQNFQAVASGNWSIGRTNSGASYVNGQITDFRVQHGEAITPPSGGPTERLTANSNTKFFYAGTPYVVDGSSNNYSITLNNGAKISPATPFDNLEYSAADHGGSVSMPNDNDYLYVPHSSTLKPSGTDPFCVSFWYYPTTSPGTDRQLVGDFQVVSYPSNCPGWDILYQTSGAINARWGYPNYADTGSGITNNIPIINAWNHIVFCRSGGSLSLFLNGKRCNTTTSNINISASGLANFYVGYAGESTGSAMNSAMGTIADFKYEVGTSQFDATASTITVPTAPQSTTNSVLHVKGTDASIIDKSQSSNLQLIGNTTGSTTQVKFANTKSMYFDGAGDYITADQIPFGTGDFTIEAYTYLDSRVTIYPGIFSNYSAFGSQALGLIAGHQGSTQTNFQVAHNGTFPALNAGSITYDQWVHLCLERYNGTITFYIDGSSVGSFSSTVSLNGVGSNFYIGALGDAISQSYIDGWMQDFRVTTGLARYTANFTPPTAPLKG